MTGRRPTLKQKKIIAGIRLNPENWLVIKNPLNKLYIKHRWTGSVRIIPT